MEKKSRKIHIKIKRKKGDIRRFYFGYNERFFTSSITLIALLIGTILLITMSFKITKKEYINYREKSNIDYRVYLKDNNFYDYEYLEKNMAYVASLIDDIKINYNYIFEADKKSNLDIDYKIIAKLVIASQNNSNIFYEKEFEQVPEKKDELINKNQYIINEEVIIDYDYYNDLANQFKSNYAVNTNSYLEVTLYVNENNKKDNLYELSNNNKASLTIPLSQQEISINLDNKEINNNKEILNTAKLIVKNKKYATISIILLLLTILHIIHIINEYFFKINTKQSKYDRYVNRLLRGYDRIIVNTKTPPKLDNYNVIKVESFKELVDVRDNTNEPIHYFVVTKHQKCEFFLINNENLYLYTIKEIDLNGIKDED